VSFSKSFAGVLTALFAASCTVQTSDPAPTAVVVPASPTPVSGTVVFAWTVQGTTDPNGCIQTGAESIAIDVDLPEAPGAGGSYRQTCALFETSISLAPGTYTARALLVDPPCASRTTVLEVNPFTIAGNDELRIPIDFPFSSFF